ncbi:hypothetical protein C0J52_20980 [Blattella germanica]|nr:hypothetical protein C0J52_20980 [Blattella germanica]
MTDINHDTWMLSGSAVMQDGVTLRNGYGCDLDTLTTSTRIGMMRHDDESLHYYVDGVDQGAACEGVPPHVYAVVDLYGQCAQVSIVQPDRGRENAALTTGLSENSSQPVSLQHHQVANTNSHPNSETTHRFSVSCGKNVILRSGNTVATRVRNYAHALVFSNCPLEPDETFEVCIQEVAAQWAGTLHVGVTSLQISDSYPAGNLPPTISGLSADTWYITGNEVRRNSTTLKVNYCPSLEWLVTGNKVGVRRDGDGNLRFLLNGEDMGVAATNLPKRVFAVVDLYGNTLSVAVTSVRASQGPGAAGSPTEVEEAEGALAGAMAESLRSSKLHDSLEMLLDAATPTLHSARLPDLSTADVINTNISRSKSCDGKLDDVIQIISSTVPPVTTATTTTVTTTTAVSQTTVSSNQEPAETVQPIVSEFHENHGRNVQLGEGRKTAKRTASYNQGVRIDSLNPRWVSSLMVGVTCQSPEKTHFPLTALGFKKNSWIISSDCVFHNGVKVKGCYGPNLDSLQSCHLVGILVDIESRLHLYVNGIDQGVAACDIPMEATQTQLESESLSEKADLECDEKEKLSELLASCGSGENSVRVTSENVISSGAGDFSPPVNPYVNTATSPICPASTNTNLKSLNIPMSQISPSAITTSPLSLSNASNIVPVVSNATNVIISNLNAVPNVTTNVGSDTNLMAAISDSNVDIVLNQGMVMNTSTTNIPTPGAMSMQFNQPSTAPTTPVSSAPSAAVKNCEYLNACARFKSMLGLPDGFFSFSDSIGGGICYCECCQKLRSGGGSVQQVYHNQKGEPVPSGWCRFALRRPPGTPDPDSAADKWHVAFSGARLADVRTVLDHGQLLLPDIWIPRRNVNMKQELHSNF